MYFLNEIEQKLFLRKMLPKARNLQVKEELRGWNWHQAPLDPIYEEKLAVYEASNAYCPTHRDLYVRRVLKAKANPNYFMISGKAFHQIIVNVIENAKKLIYQQGALPQNGLINALRQPPEISWPAEMKSLPEEQREELLTKGKYLLNYEQGRISARVEEVLTQQPYIGADALAHLAIPVVCEYKLDGRFLGLSQHLSTDALMVSEPMVLDMKFGTPQKFHRLSTTGYALAMEALYETPVNLGCICYGEFKNGQLIVHRDMHLIDDELRQWFIESRDEKMRMIYEEIDPGLADNCQETCPAYRECH